MASLVAERQATNLVVEAQPTDLPQSIRWAGLQPIRQATLPTAQLSPTMALLTHILPVQPQDKLVPKETLPLPQTTLEHRLTAEPP